MDVFHSFLMPIFAMPSDLLFRTGLSALASTGSGRCSHLRGSCWAFQRTACMKESCDSMLTPATQSARSQECFGMKPSEWIASTVHYTVHDTDLRRFCSRLALG